MTAIIFENFTDMLSNVLWFSIGCISRRNVEFLTGVCLMMYEGSNLG